MSNVSRPMEATTGPVRAPFSLPRWLKNVWRGIGCPHRLYQANLVVSKCDRADGHPGLHTSWTRWS